ncbi:hypothetical protein ACJMK2_019250 [Sinanodonta woodiana]|uniref:Uncharacterized protein n=1 Tax=Sinanodonta woodiana TaxID=1069815 RepID=A0ABD3UFT7_SINWO
MHANQHRQISSILSNTSTFSTSTAVILPSEQYSNNRNSASSARSNTVSVVNICGIINTFWRKRYEQPHSN